MAAAVRLTISHMPAILPASAQPISTSIYLYRPPPLNDVYEGLIPIFCQTPVNFCDSFAKCSLRSGQQRHVILLGIATVVACRHICRGGGRPIDTHAGGESIGLEKDHDFTLLR